MQEAEAGDEGPSFGSWDRLAAGDLGEKEADFVDCPCSVGVDVDNGGAPPAPTCAKRLDLCGGPAPSVARTPVELPVATKSAETVGWAWSWVTVGGRAARW